MFPVLFISRPFLSFINKYSIHTPIASFFLTTFLVHNLPPYCISRLSPLNHFFIALLSLNLSCNLYKRAHEESNPRFLRNNSSQASRRTSGGHAIGSRRRVPYRASIAAPIILSDNSKCLCTTSISLAEIQPANLSQKIVQTSPLLQQSSLASSLP